METNNLFPVFLKLESLRLLVVGGGYVGLEKLSAVARNAPATNITLVAKAISPEIRSFVTDLPSITLHERPYQVSDLDAADLVIIAINDREISKAIHADAKRMRKLVNVADTPELCDFYLGAIVQKGNLKLGISTNGKSPTIAKRLKEILSDALPDQLDDLLINMHLLRNRLAGNFEDKVRQLNEHTRVLIDQGKE